MKIAHERGSREFHRPLRKLGVPCKIAQLRFADFSFTGHGPTGLVRVGVERKRVSEITSEVDYKRFKGHQLPGLIRSYDFVYVVVEGDVRVDPRDGLLMAGKWEAGYGDRVMYETYQKRLCTLYTKIGSVRDGDHACRVMVWLTKSKIETRHYLHALYGWWQKQWADHKSAYQVEEQKTETAILDSRTWERQIYAQWPGVGWVRSKYFVHAFPTVAIAGHQAAKVYAAVKYKDVNGKWCRFGDARARTLWEFLNGMHKEQLAKG